MTVPFSCCLQMRIWNLVEHLQWSFFSKILNSFKLLTIFAKKLHRRCSTELKKGFWLRVWNAELTLVSSLQIKPRKYSSGKYVWHHFWKDERSCWERKQNDCLCRSSGPKCSLKKDLWEISQNLQKKHLCWNLFFDKVKLCRSATSLKASL